MTTEEKVVFLKNVELFKELNDSQVEIIATNTTEKTYKETEIIFNENMARKKMFVMTSGCVELYKTTAFGDEKKLSVFNSGDFFGEGALFDDSPHSTSARAIEPATTLEFSRKSLTEILKTDADIALKIFSKASKVISRRMQQTNTHLINAGAQYMSGSTRLEHDLLGERDVPAEVYYGVQTLRAIENFNISGINLTFFPDLIHGLAEVKLAAARANNELGLMDDDVTDAIVTACEEIKGGKLQAHFAVDMIQGGAGTSTNMNANEVIANRALEILGKKRGEYEVCHPNNHVNLSQSTNDAYPTAVKLALIRANKKLIDVLYELITSFDTKAKEFAHVIKMGRTQLQDAVPMTLGQEFAAYRDMLEEEIDRLQQNANLFLEINMGATAIGTGINTDPAYSGKVMQHLRNETGLNLKLAGNLVEATQDTGAFVMYSSAVKRLAVKLSKISNDLRLLSSGPRTGLNEINLPKMQPGSSIMPGKVNPVIPEVVNQIAFKVIGNDLTVTLGAEAGQLELNVMEPVIVQSILESIEMLKNGMKTLKYRCIDDITANEDICRASVMNSIGLVTALNPVLGYEICTSLAKEALTSGRGVYELVLERELLTKEELDDILKPENMIQPRKMKH